MSIQIIKMRDTLVRITECFKIDFIRVLLPYEEISNSVVPELGIFKYSSGTLKRMLQTDTRYLKFIMNFYLARTYLRLNIR